MTRSTKKLFAFPFVLTIGLAAFSGISYAQDTTPPQIQIINPKVRGIKIVPTDTITIEGIVKDNSEVMSILINKKRVEAELGKVVRFSYEVQLKEGENAILIEAFDIFGNRSSKIIKVVAKGKPTASLTKPNLWVLAIGVSDYKDPNMSLRFADNDAYSIASYFKAQEGVLFDRVFTEILVDRKATRERIFEAFSRFLGKASFEDVVVIFIAGHGIKHKMTGSYYFLTWDATPRNMMARALRWTDFDEAVSVVRQNVSKVILLVDTCHAGAMKVAMRGIEAGEELTQILKKAEGTFILAASKPGEDSMESERFKLTGEIEGHGAFTYSILKGLRGKADLDKDGNISITELFRHVAKDVPFLTEGQQHPYFKAAGTDIPIYRMVKVMSEEEVVKVIDKEAMMETVGEGEEEEKPEVAKIPEVRPKMETIHLANRIRISVKAGLSLANLSFEELADIPKSSRTGILVGAGVELDLSKYLSAGFDLLYTQKGMKFKVEGIVNIIELNYITIPMNLKIQYPIKAVDVIVKPFALLSSEIGFLSSAKERIDGKEEDIRGYTNSIDYGLGLGAGVGLNVTDKIFASLSGRYVLGLANTYRVGGEEIYNRLMLILLGAGILF